MKKILTLITLNFVFFSASTQISTDELPVSFNETIGVAIQNRETDLKIMPSLDMARIQQEDERDAQNGLPPRFGFPHAVSFNLLNSGVWTTLPNGDRIWQLSIHCPGALSINLLYDQFWLPEKAKLFLYTDDRKHILGAFTSRNNKGSANDIQGFATGLLYGRTIIL
ncbi:hypothetical protein [Alkalitalea saponilacus]|uniref:Uncharacterized protein n=1 Tax=Alkalitalea saponilacus TaxID=889453 RepID=A0A1T5GPJ5_9BACT|nr:hypothetical protein [Alkalitalea saponilacus]ASB48232.1 hypothetical protein CDL62_03285 [Alkalitalea saponilacus]SKC10364.1 hypothetical protein SAMN03080601_01913 [Alkalitalea saponilacus]